MSCLMRYFARALLKQIGLVLLLLLGIAAFILLMGEMHNIGKGNYALSHAFRFMLLSLPAQFSLLFPVACLIGTLLALGSFAEQHELVVMRAAGVSPLNIAGYVLKTTLLLALCAFAITEWMAPSSLHWAMQLKSSAKSGGRAVSTLHGVWFKQGRSFFHVNTVLAGDQLQGITRYDFNSQQKLQQVTYAARARYQPASLKKPWQLDNVSVTTMSATQVQTRHVPQLAWQLSISPSWLSMAKITANEMSLNRLARYLQYLRRNGHESGGFAVQFWQRVFSPLTTLVMVFLAIPLIFGPLRSATMGLRLVCGVLLGFGFFSLNQLIIPLSSYLQWSPMLGAVLPSLLFATLGYGLMRRSS